MKHDLTSLNSKGHQTSLLIALPQWYCISSLGFICISVPDYIFFSCSFPTLKKKRILNSSDYFLVRLSWLTVLLKLASFKAKGAFKWKAVIKNLEQEAEALKEDRKNPWPESAYFPMGFLLSAQLKSCRPAQGHPIMAIQPKGVVYKVSFPWLFSAKTIGGQVGQRFPQKVLFM